MKGHTAHTGHTRAVDTERESQITHGDLDHGVHVHMYVKCIFDLFLRSGVRNFNLTSLKDKKETWKRLGRKLKFNVMLQFHLMLNLWVVRFILISSMFPLSKRTFVSPVVVKTFDILKWNINFQLSSCSGSERTFMTFLGDKIEVLCTLKNKGYVLIIVTLGFKIVTLNQNSP